MLEIIAGILMGVVGLCGIGTFIAAIIVIILIARGK